MQTVNIAELKNNLSAYLERVRHDEEVIVKDRNRPIARLISLAAGFTVASQIGVPASWRAATLKAR